ncbi:anthranilate phosphoribosyltransferase [Anaerosporomusa subterranea]|uniref:Anthranilate phosphoribosyltransferase n=1 Tax=Anaerosporomusa subterranea TaxID=1794912 RepID=A0A154BPA7_ANASB|nr:anthranilate phosphoribosyltransferase [Anaerosporomusa subterranea]KYZ75853.1 anthranilate phosphoribosyltransferase [Anaerosporomusa subterranea]
MFQTILQRVVLGENLSEPEAECMMETIVEGSATAAQIGSMLTALSIKGETIEEIAGCARVMRRKATPVSTPGRVVDTCGTGGDKKNTFNISTTAAFVVAGAGLTVAKHGNRSVSSKCGSSDVLESLGIPINLDATAVAESLRKVNIGFLFAPQFHQAMKTVVGPRREIGIRTIFNILGPLTNPSGASCQLLGVFQPELTEMLAGVLQRLGAEHALVVHGMDGLDEVSISAPTKVTELKAGQIYTYYISPEDVGFQRADMSVIIGGNAAENGQILLNILQGEQGPRREVVLFNAAAALVAGDKADSLREGVALAAASIDSGQALAKFTELKLFQSEALQ